MKKYCIGVSAEFEMDLKDDIESHEIFAILKEKFPKFAEESGRFWISYFGEKIEVDWKNDGTK